MGWKSWLGWGGAGRGTASDAPATGFRATVACGGTVSLDIPAAYQCETDEEGTLLAFPPGDDTVVLRVSVITFRTQDGRSGKGAGADHCREQARKKGLPLEELGDRAIMIDQSHETENGTPLLIETWTIGGDEAIAVVTVTTVAAQLEAASAQQLRAGMPRVVRSLRFLQHVEVVETANGPLETRVSRTDQSPHRIDPFGPEDDQWLAEALLAVHALARRYNVAQNHMLTPSQLDRLFSLWMSDSSSRPSADTVADGVGAAMGEHLVQAGGMSWVVVTDEDGRTRAVHHPRGSTLAFPVSSVMKRIESGETQFVEAVAEVVLQRIRTADEPV